MAEPSPPDDRASAPTSAPTSDVTDETTDDALAFAGELVTRLGLRATAAQASAVEHRKPAAALSGSVVTDVDLELERAVDEALLARFPGDGLVGEEGTDRPVPAPGRTWVVDPVDGTLNYARRLGPWSVVLSAWRGDACELVAVWTGGVLYTAAAGRGAHRDGERLHLGPDVEAGGIVRAAAALLPAVQRAGWLAKVVESSAAEVVSVADGRVVGTVRRRGDRRDLHGPALVVAEAGGAVVDLDGRPADGAAAGLVVCAPGAVDAMLALAHGTAGDAPGADARD